MLCQSCRVENVKGEMYCRECGADLRVPSKSLVTLQARLPAVLYQSPVPRWVAAGIGALALGMGIELLRRGVLSHLQLGRVRMAGGLKDMLFSRPGTSVKLPKGYELHETVMYMSRVVRRKP
jgi:hypothetical protein